MNAMVGDAGAFSATGVNVNNPAYRQFFKITQIPQPTEIFVFLDEHPDSIDDGYFLNKYASTTSNPYPSSSSTTNTEEWLHLPASYHNRASAFSFADGHAALHRWLSATTVRPPAPDVSDLPIQLSAAPSEALADFYWILQHTSIQD
jgi:prepilin-type processing-associated H-X9-DG protein